MEIEYLRALLDKALKQDGESIWFLICCHIRGDFGLPPQPFILIKYLASNFDVGEKSPNDCEWIRVESCPNIVELLEQGKEPDLHNILIKTIKYRTLEYNKNPLSVVPYYRLKETIDEDWKIAQENQERKAKEEVERKAKEEAERKAKEEAERKAKEEAERKAKEEAERKAKEEAERNSYKFLIEEFVSDTKECEYKDGIIFGKKKTIRYVATPITKHIWNAVVNKSAESDFDDDEYVPQKELGDFIKELNAHFEGSVVFEYLHKNIHANVHLQVYEKLDKNACFVYIKEDNR